MGLSEKLHRRILMVIAVLATATVTPACYTLLRHPRVLRVAQYEDVEDQRCKNCHAEEEVWGYHHSPHHYYVYDARYPAWGVFYDIPWWYNANWYYDQSQPAATTPPGTVGPKSANVKLKKDLPQD